MNTGPSAEHYLPRLLGALRHQPDRPVLHWRDTTYTAGVFHSRILGVAAGLRASGVTIGDLVAILTEPNHPAMLAVRYAAHLLGAAVAHIRSANPRADALLETTAQARLLRETSARLLVVDGAHLDRARILREALSEGARPVHVPIAGFGAGPDDIPDDIEEVTAGLEGGGAAPPATNRLAAVEAAAKDLAVVALTSGSTGRPKGVRQSFRTWNSLVDTFPGTVEATVPPVMLVVTPLDHTIGSMVDAVLIAGGSIILHESFDVPAVVRALRDERVTDTYLAVPHLYQLLQHAGPAALDTGSLRRLIYSGTPAAPHRLADASRVFGRALFQLYGSTEAGGISSLSPLDHGEPELLPTVGRPFPWVVVRVRDPETGAELPPGRTGEIWVRSHTIMDGYLGDPQLTDEVLSDGWLRTGDLGHKDQYGYLRLVDRVANVVKTGGLKVYPAATEQAMLRHPDVTDAVAFGVRDMDRVEHLHAAITLRRGSVCSPDQVRAHVTQELSAAYAPVDITVWPDLPRTGAGKPDRGYLRAQAERRGRTARGAPTVQAAGTP